MADRTTRKVYALIPAAGRGVRFGSPENKVFVPLLGRPLLGWTLQSFADCDAVDRIILVGSESDLPRLREIGEQYGGGKLADVVLGGDTRQESVRLGIAACPSHDESDVIVIHDAARCCVTPELITQTIASAREHHGGAIAACPITDSLLREDRLQDLSDNEEKSWVGDYIDRTALWRVQTPQTFRASSLLEAHRFAKDEGVSATDDGALFQRYFFRVEIISSSPENIKVTLPEDLRMAEAILMRRLAVAGRPPTPKSGGAGGQEGEVRSMVEPDDSDVSPLASPELGVGGRPASPTFRVGHGYDVHPFAEGRELWLGGVHFPESPLGLLGHSDADALLHAVCDALLGAAGMGDIGILFPPSDPRHKDRRSIEFLAEVKSRLDATNWRIGNIDISVLAEFPKIGPRAGDIKQTIAVCLGISADAVSVKATTNEKMGFVGRGEGIAVHATTLIYR
ncbi:MAG: 2-C-methyl-D-erythritol 4-phosphate cytidylyltransferase [Fibrella sp.]|nr:2-C-methyl-D-erythritol 4-phosphate cytidylyltransferase [Armatimonadota bacterium]